MKNRQYIRKFYLLNSCQISEILELETSDFKRKTLFFINVSSSTRPREGTAGVKETRSWTSDTWSGYLEQEPEARTWWPEPVGQGLKSEPRGITWN